MINFLNLKLFFFVIFAINLAHPSAVDNKHLYTIKSILKDQSSSDESDFDFEEQDLPCVMNSFNLTDLDDGVPENMKIDLPSSTTDENIGGFLQMGSFVALAGIKCKIIRNDETFIKKLDADLTKAFKRAEKISQSDVISCLNENPDPKCKEINKKTDSFAVSLVGFGANYNHCSKKDFEAYKNKIMLTYFLTDYKNMTEAEISAAMFWVVKKAMADFIQSFLDCTSDDRPIIYVNLVPK